jgi:hypothetical protein
LLFLSENTKSRTQRSQINHLNLVWNSGVQNPL